MSRKKIKTKGLQKPGEKGKEKKQHTGRDEVCVSPSTGKDR